jgi:general secretion pathway protein G
MSKRRLSLVLALALVFVSSCWTTIALMAPLDRGYEQRKAAYSIQAYMTAMELFANDYHRLPTETEGLRVLVEPPGDNSSRRSYLQGLRRDPWGSAYIYKVTDASHRAFVIYSAGPNGIDEEGANDDIIAGPKDYPCAAFSTCPTASDYVGAGAAITALLSALALAIIFVVTAARYARRLF